MLLILLSSVVLRELERFQLLDEVPAVAEGTTVRRGARFDDVLGNLTCGPARG